MKRSVLFLVSLLIVSALEAQVGNTVGVTLKESGVFEGLVLFSPVESTNTYLIDNCGQVINKWTSDYRPGSSVYLREDGILVRTIKNSNDNFVAPKGPGGGVEMFNWEGELIWSFDYNTGPNLQHHDIALLPNGNILLLAWDRHLYDESIENGRNPEQMKDDEVWSEHVVEIDPSLSDGENVVWSWYAWDHLIQDFDSEKLNYGVVGEHPELINLNYTESTTEADWIHANSLDYNPDLDQIVINSRNLNEFWVIDHSTTTEEAAGHSGGNAGMGGDIIYRWGNAAVYNQGTTGNQKLFGQHDVRWITENDAEIGNIMIFNNGFKRPEGAYSSIDIITPPIDGFNYLVTNSVFGPNELKSSYTTESPEDFYSFFMSGAHLLSNGNIFVCSSASGTFFEVNSDGQIVWEYINPDSQRGVLTQGDSPKDNNAYDNLVFRATKYSMDYPAFVDKDLTAVETIEVNPNGVSCSVITSVEDNLSEDLVIYPQPAIDNLTIKGVSSFKILNLQGQILLEVGEVSESYQVDIANWPAGLYLFKSGKQQRKIIIH